MANAYERHDISDESWAKIEFLLPGRKGTWGGNARDNRQFINAVFWILRTVPFSRCSNSFLRQNEVPVSPGEFFEK